jgi:AraC family transcriptional activator of pobA
MIRESASEASPNHPAVLATSIDAGLADQTWSTRTIDGEPCFRVFLLLRGQAVFVGREQAAVELTGPQMFWAPFETGGNFRVRAGGDGASVLATEDLVSRIVGDNPLSASLRRTLDHVLVAPAERLEPFVAELETLFTALARETRDPGPGASAASALYLGLIIMHLWRACAASEGDGLNAPAPTVQRFRQLVEMHYRDNLRVDEFCRMLNVTRAHLHSSCLRAFGRPPQRLVHDRLAVEARLRLGQSAAPIEQVAYSLGFRDPAYFNRFFRRLTGVSPGAYRRSVRLSPPKEQTAFEAWP